MDIYQGSVQVPKLKDNQYPGWRIQFQATCGVKGVGAALLPSFDGNLPDNSEYGPSDFADEANPTADEKKKYKAVVKNNLATSLIYSSISPDLAVEASGKCGTTEYPLGKAHELMSFIKNKNVEDDSLTPVELKLAVNQISMSRNEDPETLETQIANVKQKYTSVGKVADEDDLVAQVLSVAPVIYSSVLTTEQSIIKSKGEAVTSEKLVKAMRLQYRIANNLKQGGNNGQSEDEDEKGDKSEAALTNANGGDRHRRNYFNGTCKECGLPGHKKWDCWELKKNAHKRPHWWKSRKTNDEEVAVTELCLASLTIGQDFCPAC